MTGHPYNYSATTLTKASSQNFLQFNEIWKLWGLTILSAYKFSLNQAVHYKGNRFVLILINDYLKSFKCQWSICKEFGWVALNGWSNCTA